MRLCTRQFGTDMTLTRQAAPGAPREVVARISLGKWPTPSWIHDFPVTCVAAAFVQPCLCRTNKMIDHTLILSVQCKVSVCACAGPTTRLFRSSPAASTCRCGLPARAQEMWTSHVSLSACNMCISHWLSHFSGMQHRHQSLLVSSETTLTHVRTHAGCRGGRRGVHHV